MSRILDERPAETPADSSSDDRPPARQVAIMEIERKRAFQIHAVAYLIGVVLLVVIWAIGEYHNAGGWPTHGFSQSSGIHDVWNVWIIYPVLGWGAFVAAHGWFTYLRKPISEREIKREMDRQAGRPR